LLDHVPEGTEVEYKSDLPVKGGRAQDAWHTGGAIGEYAPNAIAEEIVAFANAMGGVVCIGIEETGEHPKRADKPQPLPRVHELARRLRQAVYDVINPPLSMLESVGIDLDDRGNGVVVLRVPPSRRRPHRHAVSKEVFYRRADESVRISMREIQELTIQALSENARIDAKIEMRRTQFLEETSQSLKGWHKSHEDIWGVSFQFLALPASPIDLVRVVNRPKLIDLSSIVIARTGSGDKEMKWPYLPQAAWKPGLRSVSTARTSDTRRINYSLQTDGCCELSSFLKLTEDRPEIYESWLVGAFRAVSRDGQASLSAGFESHYDDDGQLPLGAFRFPLISVGSSDEAPTLLSRFDEDIWNIAGQAGRRTPIFAMP
jgi:hypothetical protein